MDSSLSPDRIDRAIEAARRLNPELNIFTFIEDTVTPSGDGPLAGVPVAVKDMIDHAGRVTTCGSAFYRYQATTTAASIAALEAAGATVIGRTGMHEWAFGFSSENPHWGPVRNPWDPRLSTGGSSGGSAAAVAAGIVPIAVGTDTGGSIRVPSALCGTFGLKVTYGRIPLTGVFPLVPSIDSVGPIADSVENLSLAYSVMSGEPVGTAEIGSLRIGVPEPWFQEAPMSQEVADAFSHTVASLSDLGHEVVEVSMPDVGPSHHIGWALAEEVREVHREFREQGEVYGEDVALRLTDAEAVSEQEARAGRVWQGQMRSEFAGALSNVDLLITPTVPVRSKVIGEEMIGDRHYRAVLSYFAAVVNHALHPAIAMPVLGTGAPPLSLQAIGPIDGESLLLGFARQLERAGVVGFVVAEGGPEAPGTG